MVSFNQYGVWKSYGCRSTSKKYEKLSRGYGYIKKDAIMRSTLNKNVTVNVSLYPVSTPWPLYCLVLLDKTLLQTTYI